MAIPDTLAARLIETTFDNALGGKFLMLGRQRWIGSRRSKAAAYLKATIEKYLPDRSEDDLRNPDNEFSETFFETLGYDTIDSMDFSEFEGASIIQDLSQPLAPLIE